MLTLMFSSPFLCGGAPTLSLFGLIDVHSWTVCALMIYIYHCHSLCTFFFLKNLRNLILLEHKTSVINYV